MRAFLFANATAATFLLRRSISLRANFRHNPPFPGKPDDGSRTVDQQGSQVGVTTFADAQQISGLPPLECCLGTNPSQAASCRPFLNSLASPTVATIALAVIGPMPGNLRQTCWLASFSRCHS